VTQRQRAFAAVANVIPGIWNVPGAIGMMDDLVDLVEKQQPQTRQIGPEGVKLIQDFEGYEPTSYKDPGTGWEPFTGGWGTTRDEDGNPLQLGVTWPKERWTALFTRDLQKYADEVSKAIGDAPTTQNQFDALVSFHYNTGAIGRATLTKRHVAGAHDDAAREFAKWNKAGGRVLAGLTRRRKAEAELYARS
jgi:GH24 family phage-related lysozyme (muramidase)